MDVGPPRRRATDVENERERIHRRVEINAILRVSPVWRVQFTAQLTMIAAAIFLMPRDDWVDYARAIFVGSAAFYLALATVVMWVYSEAQRTVQGHARLLPRHVRWTVVGDVLKTLGACGIVVALAGEEGLLGGIPTVTMAIGITIQSVALGIMWRFQLVRALGERFRRGDV